MTDEIIENILEGLASAGLCGLQEIEHVDEATWMLIFDDDTGVGINAAVAVTNWRFWPRLAELQSIGDSPSTKQPCASTPFGVARKARASRWMGPTVSSLWSTS